LRQRTPARLGSKLFIMIFCFAVDSSQLFWKPYILIFWLASLAPYKNNY
jgi:hypothetical protein